jgi:hypothetical protein
MSRFEETQRLFTKELVEAEAGEKWEKAALICDLKSSAYKVMNRPDVTVYKSVDMSPPLVGPRTTSTRPCWMRSGRCFLGVTWR